MYEPKHGTRHDADSPEAEAARTRLEHLAADPDERAKASENDRLAR